MKTHTKTIAALAVIGAMTVAIPATGASKLITGKNVKNNSLTGVDIKDRSLGVSELNPGLTNQLRGPQGQKGERGDVTTVDGTTIVGPPGPPGSFASIVRRFGSGNGNAMAVCDTGEHVTGGGGYAPGMNSSLPVTNGDGRDAWQITGSGVVTVYAICVR